MLKQAAGGDASERRIFGHSTADCGREETTDPHGKIGFAAAVTDAKRRVKALVRADGMISLGDAGGSIHRIGAAESPLIPCTASQPPPGMLR